MQKCWKKSKPKTINDYKSHKNGRKGELGPNKHFTGELGSAEKKGWIGSYNIEKIESKIASGAQLKDNKVSRVTLRS